jgi:FtsP/CotA-like multicopper oxidase with cupredoxin domain
MRTQTKRLKRDNLPPVTTDFDQSTSKSETVSDGQTQWSRRSLLGTALVSMGTIATIGIPSISGAAQGQGGLNGGGHNQDPWYPLQVPNVVPPNLTMLSCAPAQVNMGDGVQRWVWAYNGRLPGPTWVARTGDTVTTTLFNGLDDHTITHWHGLIVDFENDGGPLLHIEPGQTYNYGFPIIQRAGLNFYHPHPHMLTGEQVAMGLAGAFIIRDDEEDALGLPSGAYEVPLVIRDASFDSRGNMLYNPTSTGFKGKFPLVNGTLRPMLNVDRGVYRFRVVNGSNARVFKLALSNGAPMTIIGNDGGLLRSPATATQIELGMAERLDLLVDFSALSAGQSVTLRCLGAKWDLIRFVGTGAQGVTYSPPAILSTIETLVGPSTPTRTFSFDGMSRINGQVYDMNRIDFQVPFGTVERWRFITGGNAPHPVHVHGASFQVKSRTKGRGTLFPWEAGWKDTVLLNDREIVDVLIRFDAYRGLYVMHCHQLEHESMGMMTNFEVV